jgi:hypothetical protein
LLLPAILVCSQYCPGPPVRVRAGQQSVGSGTTGGRAADFGTPPNLKFSFLAVLILAGPGHEQSAAQPSLKRKVRKHSG